MDYLKSAKEGFIGRSWLFRELESSFHHTVYENDITGVLIIGNPGTGKSALSAQLVCSRTSSRIIHERILGYHLCKHSDKNTQTAGKFVRNLADMIARRIPEYGFLVSNSSHIMRSLYTDCVTIQDPVGCFEQAILTPLKNLSNVPKDNWYIVIDALDECLTQTEMRHSIMFLLKSKISRFPSWLKLVVTSRNQSTISFHAGYMKKLIIHPQDDRNYQDIELFLTTKFYRDGPLIHRVNALFGDSSKQKTDKLIDALLNRSQGNFLFVKEMIQHWETSRITRDDPYALPDTLEDLFHSYFQRYYGGREKFKAVRRVLELLVATFQPLTEKEIFNVLRTKEPSLDEEYDFKERIKPIEHFLTYGENGVVTLYHQSLTEWLTSDNTGNEPFFVSKRKGHDMLCEFYFKVIAEGDGSAISKYSFTLARHIAYGAELNQLYVRTFSTFPSEFVNCSDSKSLRTSLHLAATINNTNLLKLLLPHFSYVDSADSHGMTPAFLAAEHGLLDNLVLIVRKGVNVNHKTKSITSPDFNHGHGFADVVFESKSKFRGSTMLHAAAHGGHLSVIRFLLNKGASISTLNDVHQTAIQTAAENGHLKVVKALHEAGGVPDQTALFQAAAKNRLDVVKYLLKMGVEDKCLRCDGSFYWLEGETRLQTQIPLFEMNVLFDTLEPLYTELFDDKHLIFCQTALYASVAFGYKEVTKELVAKDKRALTCHDYTGRTPLHEAVRKNDREMVEFLLMEGQAKIESTCNHWQAVSNLTLSREEFSEYIKDVCHCGYTPLHLAARYGYREIVVYLIKSGARVEAKDCFGATPIHIAACHNHTKVLHVLLEFGAEISSKTFNGSMPLHSAAACGALETIDQLLHYGAILDAGDDNGLTALHYTILNVNSGNVGRRFFTDVNEVVTERRGHLAGFYLDENNNFKNTDFHRWLDVLIRLSLRGANINAVDVFGRTVLHIAAANGLADAVNVLLLRKAKLEVPDKTDHTPLDLAVKNSSPPPEASLFFDENSPQELRQHLRDHGMVVYLLLANGASLKKCDHRSKSLLHHSILNGEPYIAQLLLFLGAGINCKENSETTILSALLLRGHNWAHLALKHLHGPLTLECGKPFNTSVFHLICYNSPRMEYYNFFQHISCDDRTCSSKNGPLITAIEMHRLKFKLIDSCLDAEGYSPLQRAAQGANLIAVRNLIKHGANVSLLSPHGHDALTMALLNMRLDEIADNHGISAMIETSAVALELLRHKMRRGFQIVCDSSKTELTLYHLAASRGLINFIHEIFKDKKLHQLDVNCPNKDGVTPIYLAKIFCGSFGINGYFLWDHVVQFIENQGGKMQYPGKDAEYNVIYNRLYGGIPTEVNTHLRSDVRYFVTGLLSALSYRQSHTMDCRSINLLHFNRLAHGPHLFSILMEFQRELVFLKVQSFRSTIPEDICKKEQKRVDFCLHVYLKYRDVSVESSSSKLQLRLFHLMKWHEEVFGLLSCLKLTFHKHRQYFMDKKKLIHLIKQYESTTSLHHLSELCITFEAAFTSHLLHYFRDGGVAELGVVFPPEFLKQRMGWGNGFVKSWPIRFLVNFNLGFYRRYDYLKVLNSRLRSRKRTAVHPFT